MTVVVLLFCLSTFALGALGLVLPSQLRRFVRRFATPVGFYCGAAFRVVLGVALLFVYPTTRAPEFLQVLGIMLILGGLSIPLLGLAWLRGMADWFMECAPWLVRGWGVLAISFSLLLAYAVGGGPLEPGP